MSLLSEVGALVEVGVEVPKKKKMVILANDVARIVFAVLTTRKVAGMHESKVE